MIKSVKRRFGCIDFDSRYLLLKTLDFSGVFLVRVIFRVIHLGKI